MTLQGDVRTEPGSDYIVEESREVSGQEQNITAFVNVNVIPMDEERVLERQTVLIVKNRIEQIGPVEEVHIPAGAHIIDGEGYYLMPGLADMHIHLTYDSDPRHLRLYLAHGVTTVRNLAGTSEFLNWINQIEQGTLIGPTIYTTGPIILGSPPGFEWVHSFYLGFITVLPLILGILILIPLWIFSKLSRRKLKIFANYRKLLIGLSILLLLGGVMAWTRVIPYPEFGALVAEPDAIGVAVAADAEYAVKKEYAAGYRAIKPYDWINEETFLAAIQTAESLGMYSVGHAPDQVPIQTVLESGLDEIAHVDELLSYFMIGYDPANVASVADMESYELDYGMIPEIVALAKKNGVRVTSSLVNNENFYLFLEDAEDFYSDPAFRFVRPEVLNRWQTTGRIVNWKGQEDWRRNQTQPFLLELIRALHEAGVPINLGTDAHVDSIIPGYHVHRELEILVEAGFSPYEALATSTINAALTGKIIDGDGNWGAVSTGNWADLILLQENPLENISNTRNRIGVMVRGQWYTQAELDELVDEYTATFEK
jgi:hypothetical protein